MAAVRRVKYLMDAPIFEHVGKELRAIPEPLSDITRRTTMPCCANHAIARAKPTGRFAAFLEDFGIPGSRVAVDAQMHHFVACFRFSPVPLAGHAVPKMRDAFNFFSRVIVGMTSGHEAYQPTPLRRALDSV